MSPLDTLINERLDLHQEYDVSDSEIIAAVRAVLSLHSPGDGEVREGYCVEIDHPVDCQCDDVVIYRCPVCVKSWAYEETQTAPCETVRAIAAAMGVTT